jgi:diguanylate cyclase (GGDEF)-like protein
MSDSSRHTLIIYSLLNRLKRPRSYTGRILLICFIGTHIPLITFCLWVLTMDGASVQTYGTELVVLLIATLAGTALTLAAVREMLAPVRVASLALKAYQEQRQLPALRRNFSDEAGELLAQVQDTTEELDRALRSLARAADTDALTGIGNRRWLTRHANEQMSRALETRKPLSAILFDLDRFKAINDQNGHAKGDAVLVGVARFVKGALNPSYLFARTGGEEFCIVLPETSLSEAFDFATKLQDSMSKLSFGQLSAGVVTASFGVTAQKPGEQDVSILLSRADEMLYEAKSEGRNRVISCPRVELAVGAALGAALEEDASDGGVLR